MAEPSINSSAKMHNFKLILKRDLRNKVKIIAWESP